jgi:hypothetical protein
VQRVRQLLVGRPDAIGMWVSFFVFTQARNRAFVFGVF